MKAPSPILWLYRQIRRRIPALALMALCRIGQALLGVAFALGTRQVIDSAVSRSQSGFLRACILQASIILGIVLCNTLSLHLHEHLSAELDRDWKASLLHRLFHSDYAAVSRFHSGELLNRMNNDVRIINDGILTIVPNLAFLFTKLISAFLVLVKLDPVFALLLTTAGFLVILITAFMRRQLKALNARVSEEEGRVSGFLQESLEKLLMVQALDVADEMEKRSDSLLQQRFLIQRKRKNYSVFANSSVSLMSYIAGFAALVWCSFDLLQGKISFGTLTAITQLVSQLQSPFVSLSSVIPKYAATSAAADRLMELDTIQQEEDPSAELSQAHIDSITAIGAEGLCFSYERDSVLHDSTFCLPRGSFAVITGPSGIGKSTLLKLFLGIFRPNGGQLYLQCGSEKIPVSRSTRKAFSYVPQGNLLLSGTIRDNLILANPEATEDQIRHAVHISAMDLFLDQLPMGLDTVLGESGSGLSEGQAQRLAIARAILSGSPILLLDESTSALDASTEQLVLQRIRSLSDRTCIIVTHRSAAIEMCDWNLQIEQGKISLTSTHPLP